MPIKKIAVLTSGNGSNLQSIIDAVESGRINASICAVIADREGIYSIERAKKHGIAWYVLPRKKYPSMKEQNDALLECLKTVGAEAVILSGYLSILSEDVVRAYPNRIINIHPSLIPAFCGMGFYGKRVHQAVIDYGAKISGATVHFADEHADTGAIIIQKCVPVLESDDADALAARVLEVEHEILPEAVKLLTEDRLLVEGRKVYIKNGGKS